MVYTFRIFYLTLLCLIYFSQNISGQTDLIKFRHLTVDNGLSQNWVRSICQDSYGFIWFGIGGSGINRYDGYEIKVYKNNPKDNTSLTNNMITTIYEDKNQRLWVGTQHGLNYYDKANDRFVCYPSTRSVRFEFINSLFESDEGKLYVISINNIYEINPVDNSAIPVCKKNSGYFTGNFTCSIVKDLKNNYWVGSLHGLYMIDLKNKSFKIYRHSNNDPASISDDALQTIYRDKKGRIWIGTFSKGLCLLNYRNRDPTQPYFINFSNDPDNINSIHTGTIRAILDDGKGYLWIGTENGGLNILDLKSFEKGNIRFDHLVNNLCDETSLSHNSIYSIYEDRQGILWVGTYGGGVNYYNKLFYKFEHHRQVLNAKSPLSNNIVNVFFDESENLWIGTEGGLNILDRKTGLYKYYVTNPNNINSISSNAVCSIFKDKHGNIWVGAWAGGLNLFDRKTNTFRRYMHDESNPRSISNDNVLSITGDNYGHLWIATSGGGLNRYDYKTNEFRAYHQDFNGKNSISSEWLENVLNTSRNELWISTSDGVNILNLQTEIFTTFVHDSTNIKSISYNGANVIFEDSKKNIWVGTNGGLNFFIRKDSSFIYYGEEDGLPGNSIKAIVEDDKNNLWISTNNGISKFVNGINNPFKPAFRNYYKSDGLQGNEFCRRSGLKSANNMIYFGGLNGYNVFDPDSIKDNLFKPRVFITKFLLFNNEVAIGAKNLPLTSNISFLDKLILHYDQSVIRFKYAALNYILSENNQYAFMMEGFEKNWNYAGNKREATYTNLEPGNYTFKVKASNNDGIWNEKGASIIITILPPWYRTFWFRISLLLTILFLIYLAYSVRVEMYKKRQKELTVLVQQRTQDLENTNVLLMERQNKIEKQDAELKIDSEILKEANALLYDRQVQIEEQSEELKSINEKLLERQERIEVQAKELRKSGEELQKTNEQLSVLNATKDRFFSIIAHDLRNPFNIVSGFSEIMLKNDKLSPEKARKFLEMIHNSSASGNTLLENLLQWSRSQSGHITYAPTKLSLEAIAEETLRLFEGEAVRKKIILQQEIENQTLIMADENMIKTILRNLVSNAIKFTGENGIIAIKSNANDQSEEITVSDNGIGISKENIEKLFKIDVLVSTKGTEKESGTGLGLILCKDFVERHGGKIWVVSESGKGSEFKFTMPKA